MSSEYVLAAVSNPKEASMRGLFRSPSIVFGTPTTAQCGRFFWKYSASKAALLFDPSPPTKTKPWSSRLSQTYKSEKKGRQRKKGRKKARVKKKQRVRRKEGTKE